MKPYGAQYSPVGLHVGIFDLTGPRMEPYGACLMAVNLPFLGPRVAIRARVHSWTLIVPYGPQLGTMAMHSARFDFTGQHMELYGPYGL